MLRASRGSAIAVVHDNLHTGQARHTHPRRGRQAHAAIRHSGLNAPRPPSPFREGNGDCWPYRPGGLGPTPRWSSATLPLVDRFRWRGRLWLWAGHRDPVAHALTADRVVAEQRGRFAGGRANLDALGAGGQRAVPVCPTSAGLRRLPNRWPCANGSKKRRISPHAPSTNGWPG